MIFYSFWTALFNGLNTQTTQLLLCSEVLAAADVILDIKHSTTKLKDKMRCCYEI